MEEDTSVMIFRKSGDCNGLALPEADGQDRPRIFLKNPVPPA